MHNVRLFEIQSSFLSEIFKCSSSVGSGQTLFLGTGVVSEEGRELGLTGLTSPEANSASVNSWQRCSSRYVVNSLAYSGCFSAKSLNSSKKKWKNEQHYLKHGGWSEVHTKPGEGNSWGKPARNHSWAKSTLLWGYVDGPLQVWKIKSFPHLLDSWRN